MWIHMARKKLHREPVLKDWAEVNDALRSIHEYEHALTEMGVDMSRRIDAGKTTICALSCSAITAISSLWQSY